jgi:hypothetical protein
MDLIWLLAALDETYLHKIKKKVKKRREKRMIKGINFSG